MHKDSFSRFFLTSLGDRFLRVYYDSVRRDPCGIMLGLFDGEELVGFCAATTLQRHFNSGLIVKNFMLFMRTGLLILFTKPVAILRLLMNMTKTAKGHEEISEYAELLSIAVASNRQGEGIGRTLVAELEKQLRESGIEKISLTTDYYGNEQAIRFYRSLGYEAGYDFRAWPNRRMYRFVKSLLPSKVQ